MAESEKNCTFASLFKKLFFLNVIKMEQIPEDKLRFGLYYILEHTTGYVEALKVIHKQLPNYFRQIGYIAYGVDALARTRYRTTKEGMEHARVSYIAMSARPIK